MPQAKLSLTTLYLLLLDVLNKILASILVQETTRWLYFLTSTAGFPNRCLCPTRTPLYRILPSSSILNAALIPSLVIGQDMMMGRIPWSDTNRSMRLIATREAAAEPWTRMPFVTRPMTGSGGASALTVRR